MKNLETKLQELTELITEYTKTLKYYNESKVTLKKDMIEVAYYNKGETKWYPFQKLEFPVTDLDKRLLHYKNKLDKTKVCS